MKPVYIPWTLAAIRPDFAERIYQFNAQTRLIDVSRYFAQIGATLRWNAKTRCLELTPR